MVREHVALFRDADRAAARDSALRAKHQPRGEGDLVAAAASSTALDLRVATFGWRLSPRRCSPRRRPAGCRPGADLDRRPQPFASETPARTSRRTRLNSRRLERRTPASASRLARTYSSDPRIGRSGPQPSRRPVVTLHAQVPSGPTAIVTSVGSFPAISAVTTTKLPSLTRTPVMPPPYVEHRNRTSGSTWEAAAACLPDSASSWRTAARNAPVVVWDYRRLAQVAAVSVFNAPAPRGGGRLHNPTLWYRVAQLMEGAGTAVDAANQRVAAELRATSSQRHAGNSTRVSHRDRAGA